MLKSFFIELYYRNITINMGATKSEEFALIENKIAGYAKALSHPARIVILRLLIKNKACICGDIVDKLPLLQSTVSHQLKELKEAGLIQGDIDGAKICYCINEKEWAEAKKYLNNFMETFTHKTKCC